MNIEYTVSLESEEHFGGKAPPASLGILLTNLPVAIRQSVLMAFEGRSRTRGTMPKWLERASDIRLVGYSGDADTILHFEAPTLGDAAESLYAQHQLWETRPDEHDTGFDLFGDVLCAVRDHNAESDRFDSQLLRRISKLGKVIDGRFDRLTLAGHRYASNPAVYDAVTASAAIDMARTTPPPNRVRLVGVLDMIRASSEAFALQLDDGQEAKGVVSRSDFANLPALFQQRVLVMGDAVYRPSGKLLRIDADSIEPSSDHTSLWSKLPVASVRRIDKSQFRKMQGTQTGINAVIGEWPGDESDEEVLQALEELS